MGRYRPKNVTRWNKWGLVSAILCGTNLGIQSCTGIVEKMQNNENVTQQELQTAVKDAGQQLDTPRMRWTV